MTHHRKPHMTRGDHLSGKIRTEANDSVLAVGIMELTSACPKVIIGHDDEMFFVGFDGFLLQYYLGDQPVPAQKVNNFRQNFETRTKFCTGQSIQYRHLIIPDKQTVLPDRFPFPKCLSIMERFMDASADYMDNLLFPIEALQKAESTNRTFPVHDNHLSGFGRLVCARYLIDSLGPPLKEDVVAKLQQSLVIRPLVGHLAAMADRSDQVDTTIFIKWPQVRMYNNGKPPGKQGLTNVFCNPSALRNQRLLLMGSSSLKILAPVLASIYKEVIYCRSANVHFSLLDLLKPDVLVTGHVERFLLQTKTDDQDADQAIDLFADLSHSGPDLTYRALMDRMIMHP